MAAELVVGAFLSASLKVLFDRIASREVLDYVRGKRHYDGLLEKLKIKLLSVSVVLDDAELKQIRNPAVKMWLDELKYAADDADNLLDDIATDALERKVMEADPITSTYNIRNIFSNFIHSKDRERVTKMEEILDKLEYAAQQKDVLGLEQGRGEKPYSSRLPSTSLIPESQVYGRDDDKDAIIKMLLSDDVGSGKIGVIPIVGMGGIGKTTLAQAVFNDNEVKELFELKAWVCVSEEFDVCKVTKTILDEIDSQPCDPKNLNSLQVRLVEKLRGKKFLIVLDDVWRENSNDWDVMSRPFQNGAQGSKIIVTTRSDKVAKIMRPASTYSLKILSDEDCLRIFAWHALECEDFAAHSDLEKIGREIVKKCKGLPLAAKALGGVLWSTRDFLQWERIVKSEIWDLTDEESDILPALRLSYHYLPSHLKRCFAYCSIFPKDFKFDKEELIQLWMAENLLGHPQENKRIEDVGDKYFTELLSRSFFQKSDKSSIVMHDLMLDLAAFVSGKFCVQLDRDNPNEFVTMACHLGYSKGFHDSYEKFNSVFEASHLRTFYGVGFDYKSSYVSKEVVTSLFFKLRCLRVLSFKGYRNINQLPDSMGKLRHLRYLDLSLTPIRRLPESICLLFNLQTLKLRDCHGLIRLPKDMHRLINLRYLCFSGNSLLDMPKQISKLKNLQKLHTFVVGKDDGANIAELKELPNLRGALGVTNLHNVKKVEDALQAKLMDKKYLEELELEWERGWGWVTKTDDDSKHERDVLDKLLPNSNLKRLTIRGYGGTTFPNWVGDRSLCSNIVDLNLANCEYCHSLPPLGQLMSLKSLCIERFGVVSVGAEFYGNCSSSVVKPFASLESLRFMNMPNWEVWSMPVEDADQAFPKLRQLQVHSCVMLTGDLPHFLHSLTSLRISNCEKLACLLPKMPIVSSIHLWKCKELKIDSYSFTENRSLTSLEIGDASKFVFVMDSSYESLESLSLSNLPASLKSLPLDSFPKIKSLSIRDSPNLESISVSDRLCQGLTSLTLNVCPNFRMFPGHGFTFPSLTFLWIMKCDRLKFLPETLHNLFPSLQSLRIDNCPEVESFSVIGLPLKLRLLEISKCEKLLNSNWMSWNLKTLPHLTAFEIAGSGDVTSFPEEDLLPPTLTFLHISSLSSLETLDNSGLGALTSLEQLSISDCPKLKTIQGLPTSLQQLSISECPLLETLDNSGLLALTSLKQLWISNCPKLNALPEEGLPTSLQELSISECPLLAKKCKRKKGKYWTKISYIPSIKINSKFVNYI